MSQQDLNQLARDLERTESLRAIKDLQRSYAQYAQFGLWQDMADLFTESAEFIWGDEEIRGRTAIAEKLSVRGGGREGLPPGALHTEFVEMPVVNLSADGRTAKGRWETKAFIGDGKGSAWIRGGIYENEYALDDGAWRISRLHHYPLYSGPYATGWTNENGEDLGYVPYHYTIDETGMPIARPTGDAPETAATLEELEARAIALNDQDAVRNVQHIYGHYADRRMRDDVVDLFAEDCAVEIEGETYRGKDGVRRAMERVMGPAGLTQGIMNERPQFETVIRLMPGGREAFSRGFELCLLADCSTETGKWEINIFRNRFVKEDGLWKLKELRVFPLLKANYFVGWGAPGPGEIASGPPPAFLEPNPATGLPVRADGALPGAEPLLGEIAPAAKRTSARSESERLADVRLRLARSAAYDGTENISSAYGYYLDDFYFDGLSGIMAEKGHKQSPFCGYYIGRPNIAKAGTTMWGKQEEKRDGIAMHWRLQPVILVSEDARSTTLRTRLLEWTTHKEPSGTGHWLQARYLSGMYPGDQAVLEDGIWRLWSINIDQQYLISKDWKGGWATAKPCKPGEEPQPTKLFYEYPPDVPLTELGRRQDGFRAGVGKQMVWPDILPMWFHFKNPVSGREPELFWPDCVLHEKRPETRLTANGYQLPSVEPRPDTTGLQEADEVFGSVR